MWNVSLGVLEWCKVQQRRSHERDERRRKEEVSSSGLREGRFVCNMRELQPRGGKQTLRRKRVVRQQQLQRLIIRHSPELFRADRRKRGVYQAML